jgi:hypothetical protein
MIARRAKIGDKKPEPPLRHGRSIIAPLETGSHRIMSNPFTARWSATGNNLCLGRWEISYRGKPLKLEGDRFEKEMGTYGIFSYIFPDDEDLAEGLAEDDWVLANVDWLSALFAAHDIPLDEQHLRWFYQAVNPQDWRCGSCGGCL